MSQSERACKSEINGKRFESIKRSLTPNNIPQQGKDKRVFHRIRSENKGPLNFTSGSSFDSVPGNGLRPNGFLSGVNYQNSDSVESSFNSDIKDPISSKGSG